jgi:ADP-ribose pyrophosphatase
MDKPEIVGSETVFRGKVFSIKREVVSYKGKKFRKEIVEHPGAVAMLPITREGKIILEKQYRHPVGRWIYEVPAGTLEEGESPEECAIRELMEETGYDVLKLEKLGSCYLSPGYSTERIHFFLARVGQRGKANREASEFIELREFELEEVLDMVARGEIEDGKTLALLLLSGLKMGFLKKVRPG